MRFMVNRKRILVVSVCLAAAAIALLAYILYSYTTSTNNKEESNGDIAQSTVYASEETDAITTEAAQIANNEMQPDVAVKKILDYLESGKGNERERAYMYASAANYYYIYGGNLQEALNLYKKAIDLTPNDPTWYASIGSMYYLNDDEQEAKKYFEHALDVYDTKLQDNYAGKGREYYVGLIEGTDPYLKMQKGEQ